MQTPIIQKGTLLIARPTLLSDVFNRSVVLITDHSDKGSIGFVLNKTMGIPVRDFLSEISSEEMVFEGGPVDQENLFYLHCRPDLIQESEHIRDDVYWSGKFEDVKLSLNQGKLNNDEIRFYLGYSGWSSQQLEEEIERNAWTVINDFDFHIFQEWDNDLWRNLMIELGGENLLWSNMPENPALN